MSDLLMETTFTKVEWNFATTINGELYVTMLLAGLTALWCVGNLDLAMLVCTFL
jgi:hypothetical protein